MAKRANMGGADRVVEELHKQRSEGMQRDLLLLQHEILAKDTEINRWRDVALAGSGMSAGMAGSGMSAGMADYNPEAQVLRQRTDSLQRDLTLCQQEMRNKDTEIARWREAASGAGHLLPGVLAEPADAEAWRETHGEIEALRATLDDRDAEIRTLHEHMSQHVVTEEHAAAAAVARHTDYANDLSKAQEAKEEAEEAKEEAEGALQAAHEKARQHGMQASAIVSSLKAVCKLADAITNNQETLPEACVKNEPLRCSDLEVLEEQLFDMGDELKQLRMQARGITTAVVSIKADSESELQQVVAQKAELEAKLKEYHQLKGIVMEAATELKTRTSSLINTVQRCLKNSDSMITEDGCKVGRAQLEEWFNSMGLMNDAVDVLIQQI